MACYTYGIVKIKLHCGLGQEKGGGLMSFFIAGILPYLTAAFLIGGLIFRILKWAKAPKNLDWELFPYPKSNFERTKELVSEVLTMRLLARFNRKIWLSSTAMHWGIYLVIVWAVWLLIGWPGSEFIGALGAFLVMVGSGSLFLKRLSTAEMEKISAPLDLIFLAVLFLTALTAAVGQVFIQPEITRNYFLSLLSFSPQVPQNPYFLISILLLQLFLIYLPFSKMAHFGAKYFTYHKVKWGEPS